ncbi:hypothetical protein BD413DRAFT_484402, partial [Trametes elegans]
NATLAQRIEILDWYHAHGKNQSKTARHFDKIYPNLKLKQPAVSAWVKDKAMWRQRWEESGHGAGRSMAKRMLQTQHPEVKQMMDLWLLTVLSSNILLSGEILRQKWKSFADRCGIPANSSLVSAMVGWKSSRFAMGCVNSNTMGKLHLQTLKLSKRNGGGSRS